MSITQFGLELHLVPERHYLLYSVVRMLNKTCKLASWLTIKHLLKVIIAILPKNL